MTSWITYARPFAKRRAIYRKKLRELSLIRLENDAVDVAKRELLAGCADEVIFGAEAVKWAWADFRDQIITPTVTKE